MEADNSQLIINFIGKNSIFSEFKVFGNIYNFTKKKLKFQKFYLAQRGKKN